MRKPWWMLAVTLVVGGAAFFAGPKIWPMSPEVPMPPPALLPGYMALSVIEALAFGFAVAFALFGWPAVRRLDLGAPWLNKWLFVTLVWFTGNWWMHDNLHMHNGLNMHGMIFIEFGFHLTMLVCGFTLTLGLASLARRSGDGVGADEREATKAVA